MKMSTIRVFAVMPHAYQGRCWLLSSLLLLTSQIVTVVYAASPNDIQLQPYISNKYSANSPEILFPDDEELIAQIIPDDTLGSEGSSVIDNDDSDFINGGAIRGANLFHSFQDFNVNTGQQVYFLNPEGIETILSRVTGSNESDIDGLLGVDGTADLFLLNPNGISFGPNAELDIRGAFTASTADTLEFTDRSVFSAVNPQGTSFLTMSVPLGVQFGNLVQGNITSTGILETGQDLTLLGNQLYLEGQLIAGNDLTLQAQDTVTIRDTVTDAFIARADNDLTIQGNRGIDIWTLQHLEHIPFISGGHIALLSDGTISGDAHFESGSNFQLLTLAETPGNFVSFHDPIIFADGDVVLGDYTGVSLKVEATGSIQGGEISITGPDTALVADGSGSDEDLLASQRTAILRAGVNSASNPNLPQTIGGTTFEEDAVANQPPGSIIIDSVNTSDNNGGDGGPIIISATGNIIINGKLNSLSNSTVDDSDNGGSIAVSSRSGDITINDEVNAFSYSYEGNSGNAGSIFISALGDISTKTLNSVSASMEDLGNSSNGGNISISSISGDITINGNVASPSSSEMGNAGNGGDISIDAPLGNIIINTINTSNESGSLTSSSSASNGNTGNGGDITVSSNLGLTIDGRLESYSDSGTGATSNAGNISISSTSGDIRITQDVRATSYSSSGTTGDGGDIRIFSISGNIISTGELNSSSASFQTSGDAGNGGDITLSSMSGDIITDKRLSSFSFSNSNLGDAGNGGSISISSISGDIATNDRLTSISYSSFSNAGNGGEISVRTEGGDIIGNNARAFSSSIVLRGGAAESGGMIKLEGNNISDLELLTLSSAGPSGNIEIQSFAGGLVVSNLNLITSGQTTIEIPDDNVNGGNGTSIIDLNLSEFGQAGETTIVSDGDLTLNGVEILSDANRATDAGDVEIFSAGDIRLNNSEILTNTNASSSGDGGNILIEGANSVTINGGFINTDTEGNGQAGSIDVLTPLLNVQNGARITAETSSPVNDGMGGTVTIGADEINLSGSGTTISVSTGGPATAGNVVLSPNSSGSIEINTIGEGPQISASTATNSSGAGGNITIQDAVIAKLDNTELVTSGNGSGSAGSIFVEDVDVLLMRRGSLILAEASNTGGGGNVDIDTEFAFTIPEEDNDILATANSGQGGTVDITANLIVGFRDVEQFSPTLRGNFISDISASSNFGIDGTVRLDADPAPELTELPTDLVDPANRIAQGCRAEDFTSNDGPPGDFIITGRGGQRLEPTDIATEDAPLDDLGPDIVQPESLKPDTESSLPSNQRPIPLADSQTAIVTDSGEVFLVAEDIWQSSISCAALR